MEDQLTNSQLLVKYGFIKKGFAHLYTYDEKKKYYVLAEAKPGIKEYDPAHADEEKDEEVNLSSNQQYYKTGFPNPTKRYRLMYEAFNMSLEEMYFWSIGHVRQDGGFPFMVKVTDIFSASENSAFFGQSAQRLSIQEDRASSFLRGISEMVKTLFQIVRELRIIDERLDIYKEWRKTKSADATLKGIFADFAENKGGQMQPGSIYHLSNQVGYAVLPDLFFNTIVYEKENIDKVVDGMSFNKNVKAVLKRKLFQFLVWKEKTEKELEARRKFQIKYLRQHFTIIKTYMVWVKPYLRHIKRLTMSEEQLDSPDLISSFETSATEIEVIAYKPIPKSKYNSTILMTFKFTTRPVLQYRQEYNQGPVHVGRGIMNLRSYGWTKEQIDNYKRMRENEDFELLALVDDQLKSAMDLLGKDLENYIREAEGTLEEKEADAPLRKDKLKPINSGSSVFEPFGALFSGFGEMLSLLNPKGLDLFKSSSPKDDSDKIKAAAKGAAGVMWMVFKNYKKSHGLLSW